MARKKGKGNTPAAPEGAAVDLAAARQVAEEQAILHPDVVVTVGGREVQVREYSHLQGLRLRVHWAEFFDALYAVAVEGSAIPPFGVIERLVADRPDDYVALVCAATGLAPEFVQGLDDGDGDALLFAWWTAVGGFFTRRVLRRMATERAMRNAAGWGGPRSTSPSPPDSERPTSSGTATPPDS